jgi:hypothetical protein
LGETPHLGSCRLLDVYYPFSLPVRPQTLFSPPQLDAKGVELLLEKSNSAPRTHQLHVPALEDQFLCQEIGCCGCLDWILGPHPHSDQIGTQGRPRYFESRFKTPDCFLRGNNL